MSPRQNEGLDVSNSICLDDQKGKPIVFWDCAGFKREGYINLDN